MTPDTIPFTNLMTITRDKNLIRNPRGINRNEEIHGTSKNTIAFQSSTSNNFQTSHIYKSNVLKIKNLQNRKWEKEKREGTGDQSIMSIINRLHTP